MNRSECLNFTLPTLRHMEIDTRVSGGLKSGNPVDLPPKGAMQPPSRRRVHEPGSSYRGPPGTRGPRLHDLRHTFAVRSLEACAHDRQAVTRHIAALSTYLGHADVVNTYWYLEATPVLLHGIADATERLFQGDAA